MRFAWVSSRRQTPLHLHVLVLQTAQPGPVTPDDERQQLVLVPQAQRDVQSLLQDVARVHDHVEEVVADLVLLFQLVFLALFEFHLQLQKRLLGVGKRLGYLGRLLSQVFPIAVLSIQVERDALADALQHPRRVLDVPLDDDKIVPDHRVLVLVQGAFAIVGHFE